MMVIAYNRAIEWRVNVAKKKFTICCNVEKASGYQIFEVLAKDSDEALRIFKSRGGTFVDEEIEITSLGEPEIVESE